MSQPDAAIDEIARNEAVRRYEILDTPPDGAFDRITSIAARLFRVPIATVSIVDHDRIWFKSRLGLDAQQIDREPGLCASAILQYEPWVVNDAKVDPRTLTNALVCGELGLRFYAGVPLTTSDGFNLGTLNIIDVEPREIGDRELDMLRDLAGVVVDELELRLSALRFFEGERQRRRQGIELNDKVVQQLAVAKFALELGDATRAGDAVAAALSAASNIISDLLSAEGVESLDVGEVVRATRQVTSGERD